MVDGTGESLLPQLGDVDAWDDEVMPAICRVSTRQDPSETIAEIHKLIMGDATKYGMG